MWKIQKERTIFELNVPFSARLEDGRPVLGWLVGEAGATVMARPVVENALHSSPRPCHGSCLSSCSGIDCRRVLLLFLWQLVRCCGCSLATLLRS